MHRPLLALVLALGACRAPSTELRPDPATRAPASAAVADPAPPVASAGGARREPQAPEPAVSVAEPPAPAASVAPGGPCVIKVTGLLAGEIFRGVHRSAMRDKTMEQLSPAQRSQWQGRDHGVTYLQCRYAVTMNGRQFTYDHVAGQGMLFGRNLDVALCSQAAEMRKVEVDLRETTKQCTDPHAGAYWGFDLVPVP